MKLAFIGIGNVGFNIADNLQKKGHHIIVAHDDPSSESVREALKKNDKFESDGLQQSVDKADMAFLATPFNVNETVLHEVDFQGKTLVDCTNPVGAGVSHGLDSKVSGSEQVQKWAQNANVVKSFSIYGFENFRDSQYPDYSVRPVMLIAGDDNNAKKQVEQINDDMGFQTLDTGDLSQALHLEHMTLLWIKMVRVHGHDPNLVWACLER